MGVALASSRRKIEDRIRKKELEIQELDGKIREARAYIQALQDTIKILPREDRASGGTTLRAGSKVAMAREAILKAGSPLHISKLLKSMGREVNRKNRAGLSSSLAAYVRRNEIFTRPSPNTFGLVELSGNAAPIFPDDDDGPPPDFGKDDEIEF